MRQKKKILSMILTFTLTFMMLLNSITVQAAEKQTIIPKVDYVNAPTLEYTAGDTVNFNLHSPNYGGRVQYRVVLWDDNKKQVRDLWTAGDKYYTNWMPYGNNTFNLHWRIDEPGSYRITVYVKRAGIQNSNTALKGYNCDSYMESQAFIVNSKTTVFDKDGQTYGSVDENKVEAYNDDINITGKNVTFNNAKLEGTLTITGDNAVIRNVNIIGKIVINPGKEGSCTLDNVAAKSIEVLSGGQNSIHIIDSNAEAMNVNSQNPVRIEVDGDTEIVATSASGYVIFDRKSGTYGTITITKDENGETVVEFIGNIQDTVEVETAATIRTGQGSSIANLVINTTSNADIVKLEGQYEKLEITSEAKVEVAANTNIKGIIANNDAEIKLDKTASITNIEKRDNEVVIIGEGNVGSDTLPVNSDGGGSGSGSGSNGGGHATPTVAVSAITVTPTTMNLTVGGTTGTITAAISPANATNKNVIWSSSNTGVATAANGVVTPVAAGTAIIAAASAADGTKTVICTVIVMTADEAAATSVVETAEATPTQGNVDAAQGLVAALSDGAVKTALQGRIDIVQDIVAATALANAKTAADIELGKVAAAKSAYTTAGGADIDAVYIEVTTAATAVTDAKTSNVTADILSTTATLTTKLGALNTATTVLTDALANAKTAADIETSKVAGDQSAYTAAGGLGTDAVYTEVTTAATAVANAKTSNVTADILSATTTLTTKLGALTTATIALTEALENAKSAADVELGKVTAAQIAYTAAGGADTDAVYTEVTTAATAVANAKTSNVTADILSATTTLTTKLGVLTTATTALTEALANAKSAADIELGKVTAAQMAYTAAGGADTDVVYTEVTTAATAVTNAKTSNVTADILSATTTLTTKLGVLTIATGVLKTKAEADKITDISLGYITVGDLQTVLQKAQALVSTGYTVTVKAADGIKISMAGVATELGAGTISFTVTENATPENTADTVTLNINVGIMSKIISNFNFSKVTQLTSKAITNTDFSGVNAKRFTISDGKGNTVPINLTWKIVPSSTFTGAVKVGSAVDSLIQTYFSPDIASRTLYAASYYGGDTFFIGTYVTGADVVIQLGGSDWSYFFNTNTTNGNRDFTVSDGTKTVTIFFTQNYSNMDTLVTEINTCLTGAGINAVVEKINDSQFRIRAKTGDVNLTISGTHKTEFFN